MLRTEPCPNVVLLGFLSTLSHPCPQAWVRFEGDFLRVFGESDWDVAAALAVVSGALTESRLLPRVAAMAAPTYLSSPGTVRPRGDLELFLRDSFRALTNVVGGLPGHPNALIQRRTAPAIPEVTFLDVWDTSHVACDAAARAAQQHFLSACRGFAEQRPGACHVEEFPGIPPRVVEWLLGPRAGRPHSARMAQWVADHVNATLLILPSLPPHQTLASAPDAPANLPVIGAPPRGPLTKAAGADGARSEHETPHDLAEPRLVSRIPHRGFYAEDLRALGPGTLLLAAESITEGLAASRVLRDVLRELMSPDKVLYLPRDSEVAQALGSCGPDVWSAVEAALQVRSPPGTLVRLYRSRGPRVNVRAQGASDGRKEQARTGAPLAAWLHCRPDTLRHQRCCPAIALTVCHPSCARRPSRWRRMCWQGASLACTWQLTRQRPPSRQRGGSGAGPYACMRQMTGPPGPCRVIRLRPRPPGALFAAPFAGLRVPALPPQQRRATRSPPFSPSSPTSRRSACPRLRSHGASPPGSRRP